MTRIKKEPLYIRSLVPLPKYGLQVLPRVSGKHDHLVLWKLESKLGTQTNILLTEGLLCAQ